MTKKKLNFDKNSFPKISHFSHFLSSLLLVTFIILKVSNYGHVNYHVNNKICQKMGISAKIGRVCDKISSDFRRKKTYFFLDSHVTLFEYIPDTFVLSMLFRFEGDFWKTVA